MLLEAVLILLAVTNAAVVTAGAFKRPTPHRVGSAVFCILIALAIIVGTSQ